MAKAATRNRPSVRGGSGNRGSIQLRRMADRAVILDRDGKKVSKESPDFARGDSFGLDHVRLIGEPSKFLDLSTKLFSRGLMEGWLSAQGGDVILELDSRGRSRKVRYAIVDTPGEKEDPDSPDGRRVDHFYTLQLAEAGKAGDAIEGGADFVFNISKGIIKTYGLLAGSNDALLVLLLKSAGIEADDTLNNYDDLAALLAAANDEADATNYARKSLTSCTVTVDDTNNRLDLDIADQTWTSLGGGTNNTIGDAEVAFDPDTTTGTDSSVVPVTNHDFSVTTDGTDLTLQVAAAGFARAA